MGTLGPGEAEWPSCGRPGRPIQNLLLLLGALLSCDLGGGAQGPGEWTLWGSWSRCSSSCGRGVSVRSRRCIRLPGEDPCWGDTHGYRLCQLPDCPPGAVPFRDLQCALYNGRPVLGAPQTYQWVPFLGAPNQCDLNCLAEGHGFYRSFGRVLDGTPCGPAAQDLCVAGRCLSAGCDGLLGSGALEDRCGRCGGADDSCLWVQRVFRDAGAFAGYWNVTLIPAGARHVRVAHRSRNRLGPPAGAQPGHRVGVLAPPGALRPLPGAGAGAGLVPAAATAAGGGASAPRAPRPRVDPGPRPRALPALPGHPWARPPAAPLLRQRLCVPGPRAGPPAPRPGDALRGAGPVGLQEPRAAAGPRVRVGAGPLPLPAAGRPPGVPAGRAAPRQPRRRPGPAAAAAGRLRAALEPRGGQPSAPGRTPLPGLTRGVGPRRCPRRPRVFALGSRPHSPPKTNSHRGCGSSSCAAPAADTHTRGRDRDTHACAGTPSHVHTRVHMHAGTPHTCTHVCRDAVTATPPTRAAPGSPPGALGLVSPPSAPPLARPSGPVRFHHRVP
ncbi:ADAMTS-like protein 5 isoform X2 [Oryctolagus cuniculus]|uniref:ADAMTS-like protein 5 isoform X2 n=1 Tax=Oryctolagus cuniculus TaxID=9986 RepID=UPI002230DA50|nr:ADAMTS-like protein 5 isoform X2 [Oryctolagus cuniculus]